MKRRLKSDSFRMSILARLESHFCNLELHFWIRLKSTSGPFPVKLFFAFLNPETPVWWPWLVWTQFFVGFGHRESGNKDKTLWMVLKLKFCLSLWVLWNSFICEGVGHLFTEMCQLCLRGPKVGLPGTKIE